MGRALLVAVALCVFAGARAAATSLSLRMLGPDAASSCNDGSPAGYYVAQTSPAQPWLVFLEGGYWCWDDVSCYQRFVSSPALVSSKGWPQTVTMAGVFSSSAQSNAAVAGFNKAYVPYCSSDGWSGTRRGSGEGFNASVAETWNFLGKLVLEDVFADLRDSGLMPKSTPLVLLGGCSAGGQGVLVNLDDVADYVPEGAQLLGFADGGWLLDARPFNASVQPLRAQIAQAAQLWGAAFDATCMDKLGDRSYLCFFGQYVHAYTTTPLLFQGEQYDQFQLWYNGVSFPPSDPAQAQWVAQFRRAYELTIDSAAFAFSAACHQHCLSQDDTLYSAVQVSGRAFNATLAQLLNGESAHVVDACSVAANCSACAGTPPTAASEARERERESWM